MWKLYRTFFIMVMTLLVFLANTAIASILWYNGDYDYSGNSMSNSHEYVDYGGGSYFQSDSLVYDDFVVPSGGWRITSVWSNNLFTEDINVLGATYEIRSGVSAGNGGTIVASGSGTLSLSPTGRTSSNGNVEYQVQISGLDIELPPGRYWLSVCPTIDFNSGHSYNSATIGVNSVGLPQGDNGNSYWYVFEHFENGGEYN